MAYVGVLGEGVFDFAEFDALAAQLDLAVAAAEEFQQAVGSPADEVARWRTCVVRVGSRAGRAGTSGR